MVRELRRMHRGMWMLLGPLAIVALVVAVLTRPGPAIPSPTDAANPTDAQLTETGQPAAAGELDPEQVSDSEPSRNGGDS